VSLDAAGVDRLGAFFAAGVTHVRDQSLRAESMGHLRTIGMGIMLYRTEHRGAFPDDLQQTAQYFEKMFDQSMVNPVHPERKPGYVYVKPAGDPQKAGPETLVAYEAFDQWPGRVAVLFADGHVEGISDQKRFEHLLAGAKDADRK
jgi:prepilin-type processing-associated H-X9-DG protein